MNALTLHQPWAGLLAAGVKTIETRSWAAPKSAIGQQMAIHASKRKFNYSDLPFELNVAALKLASSRRFDLVESLGMVLGAGMLDACELVFRNSREHGKVITGCHGEEGPIRKVAIDPYGDFTPGRYLWFFSELKALAEPYPARGRQRVWRLDMSDCDL